jgi:excisionase family DNA binding protein
MRKTLHPLHRVVQHDEDDPSPAPMLAVSVNEAARITGLGRTSIYEAIARGDLHAVKAGTRTIVLMDSLRTFLVGLPRLGRTAFDLCVPLSERAR